MTMEYINLDPLNELMKRLPKGNTLVTRFNLIKDASGLSIKNMKPQIVLNLAKRINQREKCYKEQQRLIWAFGELKVFICVAIYQSIATDKEIRQFSDHDISQINSIFCSKSNLFIEYQIRVLVNLRKIAPKNWSEEELSYLSLSVDEDLSTLNQKEQEDKINWKAVSFRIFQRSNRRFFHDLNHCREMWNNHIDPRVNKQQWSIDQDIRLFTLVVQFGSRWSRIAKEFNHTRTEHMVKNRYNRFFKLWKKNADFEKQPSSDLLQLKFTKAHLKRLEAKRMTSGCDPSNDTIKTLKVEDQNLERIHSCEALIQEESIEYPQPECSIRNKDDYLQYKKEQKPSSVKQQQVKNIEQVLPEGQFNESNHEVKIFQYELYQKNVQTNHEIVEEKNQRQQKQIWQYYPFLHLYLPKGTHHYPTFI